MGFTEKATDNVNKTATSSKIIEISTESLVVNFLVALLRLHQLAQLFVGLRFVVCTDFADGFFEAV